MAMECTPSESLHSLDTDAQRAIGQTPDAERVRPPQNRTRVNAPSGTLTAAPEATVDPAQHAGQPTGAGLEFPDAALVGSLGDLGRVLAAGTEVPEGFLFASALTILGAMCSGELTADVGLDSDTRLYAVLLGESAEAKKSSARKRTVEFFESLKSTRLPHVLHGVGSAEGLARKLALHPNILLCFDELRSFVDKASVQGSVLLPMTTSLYEDHDWDNAVKDRDVSIRGARISLLGCATTDTYERMWTPEAIAIGFTNRQFVVGAERRDKVAWPVPPDACKLGDIRSRLLTQLGRLPLTLSMTGEARREWEEWYVGLPPSPHAKRLDTIGRRLLLLIALTTDKSEIDLETVKTVRKILEYELNIRRLSDPIDAENAIARMEEKIRRKLKGTRFMDKRQLHRAVNASRAGIWVFDTALRNLRQNDEVKCEGKRITLADATK